jgi:biotin carboxyl carrier protein
LEVAQADLASLRQDIISLTNELTAKQKEREEKKLLAQTKIDYAIAMKAGAISETETIRKDKIDVQMKLDALNRGGKVKAPRDGTIFRMPIFEQGQTVKEGEPLFTIIPDSAKKAVELLVPGNDMPLIKMGDEVRLQFEGWPAVQFVGWPSVSVGTFSGVVSTVDATDNGKGKFRILVVQNPKADPWPSDQFLRQGVRANGWVMLRQVSLGYEVWRQLNGFPVIVSDSEPKQKKAKKPKLPKRSK